LLACFGNYAVQASVIGLLLYGHGWESVVSWGNYSRAGGSYPSAGSVWQDNHCRSELAREYGECFREQARSYKCVYL
jgi:hypothetical protein